LSIAFFFIFFTAERVIRNTRLCLFAANFRAFTAAVFYASIILMRAVKCREITAWFFFWPAFSVAFDFIVVTAKMIVFWLARVVKVWAAYGVSVLTTTYG